MLAVQNSLTITRPFHGQVKCYKESLLTFCYAIPGDLISMLLKAYDCSLFTRSTQLHRARLPVVTHLATRGAEGGQSDQAFI